MVEAEKLRRIAALDSRAVHVGRARSTADLLSRECHLSPGEALHATRLAEDLTELPATAARLSQAAIGLEHVREASRSVRQLRTAVVDGALPIDALDHGTNAIDARIAALGTPALADTTRSVTNLRRDLAALTTTSDSLAARERLAHSNRRLWIAPATGDSDGMVRIDGLLDPLTGTKVLTALTPLARRTGPEDSRTLPQRTCDALAQLCDSAPAARHDDPAAPRTSGHPQVLLLTTPEGLENLESRRHNADTALSLLDGYGPVSSATAQRCQVHHITAWHAGGRTDLSNLTLLCQGCHTAVHHFGWATTCTLNGRHRTGPAQSVRPETPFGHDP